MTSSDPGAHPPASAREPADGDVDEFDVDGDVDDAELEELEDDAERARQRNRSTLVGAVAVVIAIALTAFGIYNVTARLAEPPAPPGVVQQMPSPPAAP